MTRIVVVGASAAGLAAAEALRREGYDGTLTLVGAEPHPPYDRPPLSKQLLAGAWEPERLALRTPAELSALGLDLRLGTAATGLDTVARTVALSDGDRLPYEALVIATGVRPRRLPGNGPQHVLRTLEDALALRERLRPGCHLAVVGAGFLGAEAAAVARGLGVEVTLLEPEPAPLARAMGAPVGAMLAALHREHGVTLRTGVAVREVCGGGVRLADGTFVAADEVLVAIGAVPNTDWLAGSGLPVRDGLVCDAYGAAAPGVYGAGDVARIHHPVSGTASRVEHRTHAAESGPAVARNLLRPGAPRPFAPVPYVWSDQYGLRLQAYGQVRGHDDLGVVEGELAERRFVVAYRTGDRLTGVLAAGLPPGVVRRWRQAVADRTPWHEAVPAAGRVP
ncbi:NAD(P)/FAD-dependent oxidoreductase [Streptomyces sp. NPDC059853]|uniref:NAD(P)/FAD-dependent oxidoreductase n=1 Tax=Streptomyces sp. NPDC059853 TaxID=3346973 RepID=UPI00364F3B83